jgi:mono/diheme cytochrome c family protein
MTTTTTLALAYVAIGFAATFLMYHLWAYPFDKATRTSAAPRWAMNLHRVLGYLFALSYVLIMWKMVPRLWQYQVEFPTRTTIHIVLGVSVGFMLILKIAILRFFRHFEEWMPFLGTGILFGSVILLALSLPFVLREQALEKSAPGGSAYSEASRARVAQLLPSAGLPSDAPIAELSETAALKVGRRVLLDECSTCHDLKTILDRPRTPQGWWSTVERMGDKPALYTSLSDEEMWKVTAYLIAITPDIQRSAKRRREDEIAKEEALRESEEEIAAIAPDPAEPVDAGVPDAAVDAAVEVATPPPPKKPAVAAVDPDRAQRIYEAKCAECHELSDVDADPPRSRSAARTLVKRMVENGLEVTRKEIDAIVWWLDAHFVKKTH